MRTKILLAYFCMPPARCLEAMGVDWASVYEHHRSREGWFSRLLRRVASSRNSQMIWLSANLQERMDATVNLFDKARRSFHLARYEFAAGHCVGKDVADIACGTGYGAELLLKQGAKFVTGVDIDLQAIKYAKATHGNEKIRYVCGSGDATGLSDASVDLITSFETVEHVPDDRALMREFHRLLRSGGLLICSTPNQWPCKDHPFHVREYDRESFLRLLAEYFEVVSLWNQNSGTSSAFNHQQPAGIVPTTDQNHHLAECLIAVCRKP